MKQPLDGIIIAGPTATGKTAVAAALCREIGGEIISADSRQVYRYLDVGTNKTGIWDPVRRVRVADGAAQHLTDIIDPSEHFSAGEFVKRAALARKTIRTNGRIPVIAGGTGLYISALVQGLAPLPERDEKVRAELSAQLAERGKDFLFERLKAVDQESAEIHKGNPQRLIRALEVYLITGKPLSSLQRVPVAPGGTYVLFGLSWPREELYALINERSARMLAGGMVDETRHVRELGYGPESPGLQSLGYRAVMEHLDGRLSYKDVLERLRRSTRQYAKRQVTWFNRMPVRWFPCTKAEFDPERIASEIARSVGDMV